MTYSDTYVGKLVLTLRAAEDERDAARQQAIDMLQRCIEDAATDENLDGCEYLKGARDELIAGGWPAPVDVQGLKAQIERLRSLVAEQAEDDGLWFHATTAAEAYLQAELRRLHAAVEQP